MSTLLFLKDNTPFYDSWESLSDDERVSNSHEKLKTILQTAREKSPFYKKHFSGAPSNPWNYLGALPLLKKSDFRKNLLPLGKDLYTEEPISVNVFQSGGTTGIPKSTYFSRAEMEGLVLPNARGFYAVGLREKDRVANMFATASLYMTFIHIGAMLEKYGCMNFPFSNFTPHEFSHSIAKLFNINCFTGITSILMDTLRAYKTLGTDGIYIDKIYYGGEHIYESDKAELKRDFGVQTIKAPGYGTIDSWYIGYQCEETDTGVFHIHDDQVIVEILHSETGKPCVKGETGSLVVTVLTRTLTPIIRYDVGDLAYFTEDRCSCGRQTPTFKLLGRGDDVLRIGFDSVDYDSIQEILSQFDGVSGNIKLQKRRCEGKDELSIFVEGEFSNKALEVKMVDAILEKRPTLRESIEKGTVHPLICQIVSMGKIERNPRTGKLKRVVDLGEP